MCLQTKKYYKSIANQISSKDQKVKSLSCVQLFVTPWTVTCQAPPSLGFSRQEYWSVLAFPSPKDHNELSKINRKEKKKNPIRKGAKEKRYFYKGDIQVVNKNVFNIISH